MKSGTDLVSCHRVRKVNEKCRKRFVQRLLHCSGLAGALEVLEGDY